MIIVRESLTDSYFQALRKEKDWGGALQSWLQMGIEPIEAADLQRR